jgi:hypothetical protein
VARTTTTATTTTPTTTAAVQIKKMKENIETI